MKKWKHRIAKEWLILLGCLFLPWIIGVCIMLVKDIKNTKPRFDPTKPYEIVKDVPKWEDTLPVDEATSEKDRSIPDNNQKLSEQEEREFQGLLKKRIDELTAKKNGDPLQPSSILTRGQKIRLAELMTRRNLSKSSNSKWDQTPPTPEELAAVNKKTEHGPWEKYAVKQPDKPNDSIPQPKATLLEKVKSVFFEQTLLISFLLYPLTILIRFTIWALKNLKPVS